MTESLISELPPEWNIYVTILEPGGFETNIRQNSILMPPHPAYGPESASRKYIGILRGDAPLLGDPAKAAQVVWNLVVGLGAEKAMNGEKNVVAGNGSAGWNGRRDWPVRLPLGSVAWKILVEKTKRTLKEAEEWEEVSYATNFDGMERDVDAF